MAILVHLLAALLGAWTMIAWVVSIGALAGGNANPLLAKLRRLLRRRRGRRSRCRCCGCFGDCAEPGRTTTRCGLMGTAG